MVPGYACVPVLRRDCCPRRRLARLSWAGSQRDFDRSPAPLHWDRKANIKWKVSLPAPGNSSPIVCGDRVFLTCSEDTGGSRRSLYCFGRSDGKRIWVRTVEYNRPDPTHQRNPYCASTPTADGERVFVWHGSAGVHCYDFEGKELWSRDLGVFRHIWGYASSPIIYGDSIILNCGPGARSFVIALDRKTGRTLWQTDEPGGAEDRGPTGNWVGSWDTPVIAKVDGHDQILVSQSHHVKAYEPTTGKILWTCDGTGDLAYADIMLGQGIAVAASGYRGPAIGFKLGGSGDVTATNRLLAPSARRNVLGPAWSSGNTCSWSVSPIYPASKWRPAVKFGSTSSRGRRSGRRSLPWATGSM